MWNSSLPYKLVKNTSTHGKILTEHLLNTSRGPQTPIKKRTRKIPIKPGKIRKREREKEADKKNDGT